MKYGLLGAVIVVHALIYSCTNDTPKSGNETNSGQQGSAGSAATDVECTHPGAGKPLGGDRCECKTTRNIAGEWSVRRTCREGDSCPARNREEAMVFTQEGANVKATRGDSYAITGVLCGDYLLWSGGSKNGLNPECGEMHFADDNRLDSDSCYVSGGECKRTYGQGCPSEKGQCTGTGARKPDSAPPIQQIICL